MAAGARIGRALRRVSRPGTGAPAKPTVAAAKAAPGRKTARVAKPAKKAPVKKSPVKKSPATKPAATKKAGAKKAPAKKAPAKKSPAKKSPAKKSPAKKAPAKKSPATKPAAAKKAPVKKAAVKKVPAKKSPAKKPAATKKAPAKNAAPTKKAPARKPASAGRHSGGITVPAGSEWTKAELREIRDELSDQLKSMRVAYDRSLADLNDLQQAGNDGAGDDQADAGSKTFEREQEQSIAANRLDLLTQIQRAVERIDSGTYGFCERCGRPIPKARLKAFPAATLDVACKQIEERR